ncbi:glucan biosynthesis protein [Pseudomonas fluorescens]|uniref:Glucan biosynthesis protein D n=1 Tax=Pseudomonas fluorescens TaxID=294 RepID=A0A944HC50_PSEFL|nr:glucan biosynthesis protein D [Pseudomonas fluorescens]MBT2298713.1 glucan biosynthesis protein D [Pseudomonas fluorescens]MBT2309896.1 glucan biosynthesis protein D [Pseudomonas fluorescens]MBT2315451.1 glucan biosynthesis protein D [Pseudomonas fluorescens]MBT2315519.1 glucan biosynthesis protein D [Pseudomonas fluorescens]MBT2328826.1 glucan biosynthesis protein D [Pseudomonas fluorescens]
MLNRREWISFTSFCVALASLKPPAAVVAGLSKTDDDTHFTFDRLVMLAEETALKPYVHPITPAESALSKIDYEALGQIRFDTRRALFANGPGRYPVTFFHLGRFFRVPVRMHVITKGIVQPITYDKTLFNMPADSPAQALARNSGFAGFRLQESRTGDQKKLDWKQNDWVAFLGASYFRGIGEQYQYGISARGIALDVAQAGKAEEFPDFTHFWFETPPDDQQPTLTLYALLDSRSLCGAYRFVISRTKGVLMDVEAALFLRQNIDRFGIAPLTSMHWFGETAKPTAIDWRPEVHDSDGLALWTGTGERIWRPLNNPARTMASAFSDNNPRGFGLLQRDRSFDHYLDGVNYQRRPSVWVEPLEDWGEGSIQLVEIPTDDEIHDNIVAMWVPKEPAEAGHQYHLKYRLHWLSDEPYPTDLARCVATRLGNGGLPGQPRPKGARKFVVEFTGAPLKKLPLGVKPEAVLWSSRGTFSNVLTEPVPDDEAGHWRALFDLSVDGNEPVEMRLYLRLADATLSESWLYQYHPFSPQPAPLTQGAFAQSSPGTKA